MKKYGLFFGLLLSAVLLAGQAFAATVAKPSGLSVPATDSDGLYTIAIGASSTAGVTYVLYEDDIVIYSGPNRTFTVTGRAAATYAYKANAIKAGDIDSAFTATKTTIVTGNGQATVAAPTSINAVTNDTDGAFTVTIGTSSTTGALYNFEESINGGAFAPVQTASTSRQYAATGKLSGNTYAYRAYASKAGMNNSAYTASTSTFVAKGDYCTTCHPTTAATWAAGRHGNSNASPGALISTCARCHAPSNELSAGGDMAVTCLGCHSFNGTTNTIVGAPADHPNVTLPAAIASCANCHDSHYSATNSIVSDFAASAHATSLLATADAFDTSKCGVCHDPHSVSVPTDAICATCHTGALVAHQGTLTNCTSCHNAHSLAAVALSVPETELPVKLSAHAQVGGQIAVTNVVVTNLGDGPDADTQEEIQITFNVTKDGQPHMFDGTPALYRAYEYGAATTAYTGTVYTQYPINNARIQVNSGAFLTATTLSATNGAYTAVVNKTPYNANSTYMITVNSLGVEETTPNSAATAVGYLGSNPRDIASNEGCINCHGLNPFSKEGEHHGQNPQGVEACVVCHAIVGSVSRGQAGDRATAYVHGIHASEQAMHAGFYDRANIVPAPANPVMGSGDFKVTFPTYMTNCSVCHTTPAQLATVNAKPMNYSLCMSCHQDWDSWYDNAGGHTGVFGLGNVDHKVFNQNTVCTGCHASATVGSFHNNLITERGGVVFNGKDLSIVEGKKIAMEITGVTRIADAAEAVADADAFDTLAITWTTKYNGATVNPCNAVADIGTPVFQHANVDPVFGQVLGGLSILRAYKQGDDFVNPGIGTSPGQPLSTNLSSTGTAATTSGFTSCAANVATTWVKLVAAEQNVTGDARIAIQGRAQAKLAQPYSGTKDVNLVRSKSPVYDINIATGAPVTARRLVTDTVSCEKCHVGSLYQHGGNRIDNMELCIMCHNEASSEQSVRVFDGVDATEAYDGKVGQTYGFKSLLHAVHSANENKAVTMVYRTNGNYVFTGEGVVVPRYPAGDVFADGGADDNPALAQEVGSGSAALIYGSSAPHGTGPVVSGPLNAVYRAHNLHAPTYPQLLTNCTACHVAGSFGIPNQAISMATTVDVGATLAPSQAASSGAVYGAQTDDTLQGTATAACMSCHQGTMAAPAGHADQGGFVPQDLPNGRADIINGVVSESCNKCHQ